MPWWGIVLIVAGVLSFLFLLIYIFADRHLWEDDAYGVSYWQGAGLLNRNQEYVTAARKQVCRGGHDDCKGTVRYQKQHPEGAWRSISEAEWHTTIRKV